MVRALTKSAFLTPPDPCVILLKFKFKIFNMLKEIFSFINPVDVVILMIFVRAVWIGTAKGMTVELFKLTGTSFATFIILHYYTDFGLILQNNIAMPTPVALGISFCLLWILVTILFRFVREGTMVMLNPENRISLVQRAGGIILAVGRAILVGGLVFVLIVTPGSKELVSAARHSLSGFLLGDVSPRVYEMTGENLIRPLFPDEKKSSAVSEFRKKFRAEP